MENYYNSFDEGRNFHDLISLKGSNTPQKEIKTPHLHICIYPYVSLYYISLRHEIKYEHLLHPLEDEIFSGESGLKIVSFSFD